MEGSFISKADFDALFKRFELLNSLFSQVYVGEAAVLIRDFINAINSNSDILTNFQNLCGISDKQLVKLKNKVKLYPKAWDVVAHLGDKDIENFNAAAITECFQNLKYNENASVFK